MTADTYLTYWCSNDDWWDYDKNGKPVVLESAPEEAQKSYQYYLERTQNSNYKKLENRKNHNDDI